MEFSSLEKENWSRLSKGTGRTQIWNLEMGHILKNFKSLEPREVIS